MPRIFISYRREDSIGQAGRIYDRLVDRFGPDAVFMDVDTIPLGVDFRAHLAQAVGHCDVLLALIGEQWLAASAQGRRRLEDPRDFVRIEIETALQRDIPVIPVLLGRAVMPREEELPDGLSHLVFRNAAHVDMGRDFHTHINRVIQALEGLATTAPPEEVVNPAKGQLTGRLVTAAQSARLVVTSAPGLQPPSSYALHLASKGEGAKIPFAPVLRLAAVTLEMWLRPTNFDPFDVVFGNNIGWEHGVGMDFNPDRLLRFYVNQWASPPHCVTSPLAEGVWSHVAATFDGATIQLFINGALVDARPYAEPIRYPAQPVCTLGTTFWQSGVYQFHGSLAEIRLWQQARTPEEIRTDMNRMLTGKERGLVAYYSLDRCQQGSPLVDLGPHRLHGEWIGAPQRVLVEAL